MFKKITFLLIAPALFFSNILSAQAIINQVIVTDNDTYDSVNKVWNYNYSVNNVNPDGIGLARLAIKEFIIPFFPDANISSITSPTDWTATIINTDEFSLGNNAEIIDWVTSSNFIATQSTLSGFGYTSTYAPGKGPFETLNQINSLFLGDPAVPLSPNAIAAGIQPIPEPETYAIIVAGLGVLGVVARRRKSKVD
jgi:hypothetical protein